jgi:type VI secretion system protein ImpK
MQHYAPHRRAGDRPFSRTRGYFDEFLMALNQALGQTHTLDPELVRVSVMDDIPGDSDHVIMQEASQIFAKLYALLKKQEDDVDTQLGVMGSAAYKEVQYIMAALADEIFITLPWRGSPFWQDNLLESKLFGTHNAGEQFFINLDRFLDTRHLMKKDVAEIYLLALGMGFQGKYRQQATVPVLKNYKETLFQFLYQEPSSFVLSDQRVSGQAYAFTLSNPNNRMLKDFLFWSGACASLLGVLLLASFISWSVVSQPIDDLTTEIIKRRNGGDR